MTAHLAKKEAPYTVTHQDLANAVRFLSIDGVEKAQSGHPGMPMGMADVATVLWQKFLTIDLSAPTWANRDRFILSAGHGSMLLYALLYLSGTPEMTLDQLKAFRQYGSLTPGHPEYGHTPGVETTTGPLGQGLATAVGMAFAEKIMGAQYPFIDHYTYVIVGDGDLMEGISHEAISFAGHHQLRKLIVLFDDNQISIDGPTSLSVSDDQVRRFEASGWQALRVDGHDPAAIEQAINEARASERPTMIACRTVIGYGAPQKQGTSGVHGAPLGIAERQAAAEKLGWSHPPFVIPEPILNTWREVGKRGAIAREQWQKTAEVHPLHEAFMQQMSAKIPEYLSTFEALKKTYHQENPRQATRQLSQSVLDALTVDVPFLIGGSADLTGSNNTKAAVQNAVFGEKLSASASKPTSHYIHYGVREHAMAAIMNGLSLYGGFIPYGGTFLVFSDYLKPALRLSALMQQGVIYVLTHDSIGLGEDGPTHQPIEHLAALRAIPNVQVMRPADAVEVAECWEIALRSRQTPSVLVLTRQAITPLPARQDTQISQSARGAYVVVDAPDRQVTLLATGSEVGLALEVHASLTEQGVCAAVVSMPCWALFDQQSAAYQESVLGKTGVRVAIEAASSFGWHRYVGEKGVIMALDHFGASAPHQTLYKEFGLTAEEITDKIYENIRFNGV